ncbi:hypothetical protein BHE74_00031097 [Ensete ventricosum]|nr:hypothetical protein GW17_00055878 [Ensete ventricosum]RWW61821.1 hypothetical protein BHE74_00031097 [Ensete ventricosum]RZR99483.1 hypothetical protein BHM03_00029031 [Ensete ventricosum]
MVPRTEGISSRGDLEVYIEVVPPSCLKGVGRRCPHTKKLSVGGGTSLLEYLLGGEEDGHSHDIWALLLAQFGKPYFVQSQNVVALEQSSVHEAHSGARLLPDQGAEIVGELLMYC